MIYTGNYKNCLKGHLVSISGDRGKSAGFNGPSFSPLAPKLSFWKAWYNSIGRIPDDINNYHYIRQYYEQVLKHLDPNDIINYFIDETILLNYEYNTELCHRHIVAYWLERNLGIKVEEVKVDEMGNIIILDRPIWIKEVLDEIILNDDLKTVAKDSQEKQLVKKLSYCDYNLDFFKKCTERK